MEVRIPLLTLHFLCGKVSDRPKPEAAITVAIISNNDPESFSGARIV